MFLVTWNNYPKVYVFGSKEGFIASSKAFCVRFSALIPAMFGTVHGLLAVGLFAVGQFAVKKNVSFG